VSTPRVPSGPRHRCASGRRYGSGRFPRNPAPAQPLPLRPRGRSSPERYALVDATHGGAFGSTRSARGAAAHKQTHTQHPWHGAGPPGRSWSATAISSAVRRCRPETRRRGCLCARLLPAGRAAPMAPPRARRRRSIGGSCGACRRSRCVCRWSPATSAPFCSEPALSTSAPGLGAPPLPHLHRDWRTPAHICTGTGLAPAHICAGTWLCCVGSVAQVLVLKLLLAASPTIRNYQGSVDLLQEVTECPAQRRPRSTPEYHPYRRVP
jgi:hypothetical protein